MVYKNTNKFLKSLKGAVPGGEEACLGIRFGGSEGRHHLAELLLVILQDPLQDLLLHGLKY